MKPVLKNKVVNVKNKSNKAQDQVVKAVDLNQTFSIVKIEENTSPSARVQI